ncbi:putative sporulation protein YtxC [Bacillus carboniphilus]|uniref:Sporulation protein YtxC n=1 Tax=Bacillus carboniphilus TaxID=86663 RepID=A0ABY9JXN0_9BACI|nr:putative sporulation protein YtxC [Bacillus carboniphilus]WLR44151.1 putative sporulation protein YtxC [Bacillus carboniphilus]
MQISFSTEQEAQSVYKWIKKRKEDKPDSVMDVSLTNESIISCHFTDSALFVSHILTPVFIQYFHYFKDTGIILTIVEQKYLFLDLDEQQEILHITQSIMEGEREGIPKIEEVTPKEKHIMEALHEIIHPHLSFSMDSFITFRLNGYQETIQQYVEIAIEEYKLEQEYQNFIQSLRDYVVTRQCQLPIVHLLHEGNYNLFNNEYLPLSYKELQQFIDRHFIYHHPMYIDSQLIAPLVSIAPKKLFIYTDQEDDNMLQTIQNIFQERVCVYNVNGFYEQKRMFNSYVK